VKAAFWLLCAGALGAQTVTVTGSVSNAITHDPIESVSVVLNSIGPTLGANSDASGRFRIPNVKPGKYRLTPSRAGFEGSSREIRIDAGAEPPSFDLTMMPWPGLRGSVFDAERQEVGNVRVRAIKGGSAPGLVYEAITDAAGRYAFDGLDPGEYVILAMPPVAENPVGPTELAPTYFPNVTDNRDALPVRLAVGNDLSGYDIVLHPVPIFRASGRVVDERGELAVGATVQTSMARGKAIVRDNGTFDLARMRPGEGSLRADWQRGNVQLRGFAKVTVSSHDVEDLTVRVAPPVAVSGTIELDGQPGHSCQGEAYLVPVDGQGEVAHAEFNESAIRFERVYPGQYRLIVEPGWVFGRHYLDSVRQGERDITQDELAVVPGIPPFQVVLKTGGGHVRGTVQDGDGGLVVLTPQDERLRIRPFIVVTFFEGGTFALGNVRPGDYYAFAVRGSFNAGEMQNIAYARAYLDAATKVRLVRNSTATLTLVYVKVPSSQ
jgi:Carboxypeptidase regulatory-like domain